MELRPSNSEDEGNNDVLIIDLEINSIIYFATSHFIQNKIVLNVRLALAYA